MLREPRGGYGAACLRAQAHFSALPRVPDVARVHPGDRPAAAAAVPALVAPIAERGVELVLGVEPAAPARSREKLVIGLIDTVYRHRWSGVGPVRALQFPALVALGMSDRGDGWDVEMLVRAVKLGLSCDEVRAPRRRAPRPAKARRARAAPHPAPRDDAIDRGMMRRDDDALERFARDFAAGTVLFEEGQPGDFMYVVQSGEVEIRRQVGETERVLAVLPPGEFFGEMAILNGRPRSATAVVRSAVARCS